jgi:hypothetical protein
VLSGSTVASCGSSSKSFWAASAMSRAKEAMSLSISSHYVSEIPGAQLPLSAM